MQSRSWTTLGSVPMRARCRTSECGKTTAAVRAVAAAATRHVVPGAHPRTLRPAGQAHGRHHDHGPVRTPTELRTDRLALGNSGRHYALTAGNLSGSFW